MPQTGSWPFVEQERDRLEQIRLSALDERICLDLELGRFDEVVAELIGLIIDHPLRELLMFALYRCSRQADVRCTRITRSERYSAMN
jgi:DNA-binding SARP family transcriptional activator